MKRLCHLLVKGSKRFLDRRCTRLNGRLIVRPREGLDLGHLLGCRDNLVSERGLVRTPLRQSADLFVDLLLETRNPSLPGGTRVKLGLHVLPEFRERLLYLIQTCLDRGLVVRPFVLGLDLVHVLLARSDCPSQALRPLGALDLRDVRIERRATREHLLCPVSPRIAIHDLVDRPSQLLPLLGVRCLLKQARILLLDAGQTTPPLFRRLRRKRLSDSRNGL